MMLERRDPGQSAANLRRADDVGVSIRKRIDACSHSEKVAPRRSSGERALLARRRTQFTNGGDTSAGPKPIVESVHGRKMPGAGSRDSAQVESVDNSQPDCGLKEKRLSDRHS